MAKIDYVIHKYHSVKGTRSFARFNGTPSQKTLIWTQNINNAMIFTNEADTIKLVGNLKVVTGFVITIVEKSKVDIPPINKVL